MPHFAQIDTNNVVVWVTYSTQDEADAYAWLIENHGGTWIRCYFNGPDYPGEGWTYDPATNTFIPPGA